MTNHNPLIFVIVMKNHPDQRAMLTEMTGLEAIKAYAEKKFEVMRGPFLSETGALFYQKFYNLIHFASVCELEVQALEQAEIAELIHDMDHED